ncbi:hypothetical protein NTGHW29_690019 [Candidatus Nitrotoga sp. HW29]|nr:hypothetical protein NTGHW29_690019 [Candidatus Nitrotoga sp. HW29]
MRYFGFGVIRRLIYTRHPHAKGVALLSAIQVNAELLTKGKKMVEKEMLRILSNALCLVHKFFRFFAVHAKFAAVLISSGNVR